jgi:REP element-mobilizing transposase RayT
VPRAPRVLVAGGHYHVIARGVAGAPIVMDDEDRRTFLTLLRLTASSRQWQLYAFCLMTTHVHLVVETPRPDLSRGMQRLLSRHAQEFNRRWQRFGHLFADRFLSRIIDDEAYLSEVCRYVLDNPVSAGIVSSASDWPWSGGAAFEDLSGV